MTRSHPKSVSSLLCALALALTFAGTAQAQEYLIFSKAFSPATIAPGSTSILTFTINSNDNHSYADMQFTDPLPAGVAVTDPMIVSENSCLFNVSATNGGQTITATGGHMSIGTASCVLAVTVTSTAADTYTNTTGNLTWTFDSNTGSDSTLTGASAKLTVDSSRPTFSKSFSPSTIAEGNPSTLTFTIDNSGTGSAADNLTFTDTLPTNLIVATPANASSTCGGTFAPSPGDTALTFSGGSVAAGGTCTIRVDVTTIDTKDEIGVYNNISGGLTSTLGDSGVAAAQLTVTWMELQKSFLTNPIAPGGTTTLEFTIINYDVLGQADNFAFTDDLNAMIPGMTATVLPADGFCGSGSTITGTSTLNMSGGVIPPDSACTFDVTVQIPESTSPGTYTNTTSILTGNIFTEVTSPTAAPASATLTVVAPPVTAIPTLNVWALIALAGLLLLSAGWLLKR